MKKNQLVVSFPSYKLGTFHAPAAAKIGRNAPCPCKSGKKYKHCCLKKLTDPIAAKVADASKRNTDYTLSPALKAPISALVTNTAEASAPPVTKKSFMGMFQKATRLIRKGVEK